MRVISVINYKGGVGKTTLVANLGAALARNGNRVLLVDLDPQASLTFSFYKVEDFEETLAKEGTIKRWFDEIIQGQGDTTLADLILAPPRVNAHISQSAGTLDLIASHLGLINVDLELASQLVGMGPSQSGGKFVEVYGRLASGLVGDTFKSYDYIIIDCPPNFNIVTKTAIAACSHILLPARPDYLSTLGISYLLDNIRTFVDDYNSYARLASKSGRRHKAIPFPKNLGIVYSMVSIHDEGPTKTDADFMARARRELSDVPVFDAKIRSRQGAFSNAAVSGVPMVLSGPPGEALTMELEHLATEFVEKLGGEGR